MTEQTRELTQKASLVGARAHLRYKPTLVAHIIDVGQSPIIL